MRELWKQINRPSFSDPAVLTLGVLSLILILIFAWEFDYSQSAPKLLTALTAALLIGLMVLPMQKSSFFLLLGTGLAIPFASFAVVVVGSEGVQWIHLFGSILIIHLVVRLILGGSIPSSPPLPWVFAFLLATILSTLAIVTQPMDHLIEFWKSEIQLIFGVLLFLSISSLRLKVSQLEMLLKSLLLMSLCIALFGLYQLPARTYLLPGAFLKFTNPSVAALAQTSQGLLNINRVASVFSEPSYFGRYIVGMLALSTTAVLHKPTLFGHRWILWLMIAVQAVALIFSFSMGAFYLAFLMSILMLLLESRREKLKLIRTIAVVIILAGAGFTIADTITEIPLTVLVGERVKGIYQFILGDESFLIPGESVKLRVDTAGVALRVWLDNPIIGVGIGSYTLISYLYGELNPHGFAANTLVNILAEAGIIGIITLLGLGFSSVLGLRKVFVGHKIFTDDSPLAKEEQDIRVFARMVFYLIAFEVLYWHFGGSVFQPGLWFWFGIAGLIPSMYLRLKRQPLT